MHLFDITNFIGQAPAGFEVLTYILNGLFVIAIFSTLVKSAISLFGNILTVWR